MRLCSRPNKGGRREGGSGGLQSTQVRRVCIPAKFPGDSGRGGKRGAEG